MVIIKQIHKFHGPLRALRFPRISIFRPLGIICRTTTLMMRTGVYKQQTSTMSSRVCCTIPILFSCPLVTIVLSVNSDKGSLSLNPLLSNIFLLILRSDIEDQLQATTVDIRAAFDYHSGTTRRVACSSRMG